MDSENATEILQLLLSHEPAPLGNWYAVSLTRLQSEAWLARVHRHMQMLYAAGQAGFEARVAGFIARFRGGCDVEADYRNLFALAAGGRERALLELCYGQLLLSCRCDSAWRHLDRGFELAAHLLDAEEYFSVLKRHDLLRILPLSPVPVCARELETLLTEARVIQKLDDRRFRVEYFSSEHRDTVD